MPRLIFSARWCKRWSQTLGELMAKFEDDNLELDVEVPEIGNFFKKLRTGFDGIVARLRKLLRDEKKDDDKDKERDRNGEPVEPDDKPATGR